jgi:carbon monoxide dehydrogenase subunit G
MRLENSFQVAAPPARAWAFLLDPELVVPCMPGAELKQVIDDKTWEALAKVKLGPVSMSFKGSVTLEERDDDAYRVVMKAKGTETRGQGMVSATITSQLEAVDGGSKVSVVTELKLSGKAATFGRGMVADVSERLTQQFAGNMESQLAAIAVLEAQQAPVAQPIAEPDPEPAPEPAPAPAPEAAEAPVEEAKADPTPKKKKKPKKKPAPKPVQKLLKPPPPKQQEIGGFGLFFWALWRAIVRFFKGS